MQEFGEIDFAEVDSVIENAQRTIAQLAGANTALPPRRHLLPVAMEDIAESSSIVDESYDATIPSEERSATENSLIEMVAMPVNDEVEIFESPNRVGAQPLAAPNLNHSDSDDVIYIDEFQAPLEIIDLRSPPFHCSNHQSGRREQYNWLGMYPSLESSNSTRPSPYNRNGASQYRIPRKQTRQRVEAFPTARASTIVPRATAALTTRASPPPPSGAAPPEVLCAICLENPFNRKPYSLVCGHMYCKQCIETAMKSCKMCPKCRRRITKKTDMHPLYN